MMKRTGVRSFLCILILTALILSAGIPVSAADADGTARPSVNGKLSVEGSRLVDASGKPVQLRGVSTHGLTWYPEFVNGDLFGEISRDWDCNLVRLAMYASAYGGAKEESFALTKKGIEAAVAANQYVIVDWHMLENGDPNEDADDAEEFFRRISAEYTDCPNILYEICNEPNGEADWADVMRYAMRIVPVIRQNAPDAVILVGTPEFDRNLAGALLRPLAYDNILYVLHFYAASHKEGLRGELEAALDKGLPVFISECGISESSGDGRIDFASAAEWFGFLNGRGISYTVWSLSDKDESSAFFRQGYEPGKTIRDSDLTLSGLWIREVIRGRDPHAIETPAPVVEKSGAEEFRSRILPRGTRDRSGLFLASLCGDRLRHPVPCLPDRRGLPRGPQEEKAHL